MEIQAMKSKKLTWFLMAALVLGAGSKAFAHGEESVDPAAFTDRKVGHLKKTLTLTDDQVAKIRPLIQAKAEEMKREQDKRKTDKQAMHDQISAVLTPDQKTKYDAMLKEQEEKWSKKV